MRFLNSDFRILNFGSATAFLSKRPTPPEFHQSEIKNQQSKMVSLSGGEQ